MQSIMFKFIFASFLTLGLIGNTFADTADHQIFTPKDIQWINGPDSLPKGSQVAVLEGDPSKEGPFTLRLKMPANYRIPPHWHPIIEHITIISGTLYVGMGDKLDQKITTALPTGSFAYMMPNMHHFALTKGNGAIVQLHGNGPWGITYIDPKDDPRKSS